MSILTYLSSLALNPVELAPAPSLSIRLITPRIFPSGSLIAMHMKLFSESSVLVKLMVLPVWATCPANITLKGTGCLFDNCCWKIEIDKSFGSVGGNCLGTRISSRDSEFENLNCCLCCKWSSLHNWLKHQTHLLEILHLSLMFAHFKDFVKRKRVVLIWQEDLTSFAVNQGQEVCQNGYHGGFDVTLVTKDSPCKLKEYLELWIWIYN